MRVHTDERRTAYCDLFGDTEGDVNAFIVKPHQRTCWHRHQKQTDQFFCLEGQILVGWFKQGQRPTYQLLFGGEDLVVIPPGYWHGYENRDAHASTLLMYLSRPYDPADEERLSEAEVPWGPFCDYCGHPTARCQCGSEKTEIDY